MANEAGPVRRDLFELYREGVEARISRLELEIRELREQHEKDMDELDRRDRERGQWSWTKFIGVLTAAAALAGLWVEAINR
jgi:predicted  nucleic acid-binding Zn-ribbon protein